MMIIVCFPKTVYICVYILLGSLHVFRCCLILFLLKRLLLWFPMSTFWLSEFVYNFCVQSMRMTVKLCTVSLRFSFWSIVLC
ncbi:hypothetical protein HanRHA438_Chr16g0787281 [Helianthus annuus]|uniref:Uncharacterized protein n=1 Tax=Helianthus annuus TaxID=4232 RepID=A0A9K3DVR8_HELAN|nr:hypothetical protein HanXRQr2_Chr16g0776511 [Helianthus annuus]KAJ0462536.1 hypothetical protein HanHA89_Chr16g0684451 [Helianthus annuus]KAJ0642934.1 hypothetical protein HanLR1_Chr16g0643861 [Helianthus annuus]KAJ0646798.1 hypothetical protein HanOQP8_Chr16g0639151 [Helianthus annuus]KAJ0823542.1 hypothetical protein HanPSC8_Chr16g0744951 [Helianthus annuus]